MWELDCEEGWALKNWCFWTVVLEKILECPLNCKEIQPVHSEGDQPWDFFGINDAKAETPVLWPPHAKSWLIGKDSDAGTDWAQEEKGTTEDEMAGWHHWLDGHESEWVPGFGDRQGGLACCDSWGHKESDTTERLIDLIWSETIAELLISESQEVKQYYNKNKIFFHLCELKIFQFCKIHPMRVRRWNKALITYYSGLVFLNIKQANKPIQCNVVSQDHCFLSSEREIPN